MVGTLTVLPAVSRKSSSLVERATNGVFHAALK
jgi:hypothetical protein